MESFSWKDDSYSFGQKSSIHCQGHVKVKSQMTSSKCILWRIFLSVLLRYQNIQI